MNKEATTAAFLRQDKFTELIVNEENVPKGDDVPLTKAPEDSRMVHLNLNLVHLTLFHITLSYILYINRRK